MPGGEYPFWVAVKGSGADATAYVSSLRDREIVVARLNGPPEFFNPVGSPHVIDRIPVKGQPNKMTLNAAHDIGVRVPGILDRDIRTTQSLLYVAEDQSDTVDVIDTTANKIVETIPVIPCIRDASIFSSAADPIYRRQHQ